MKGKCLHNAIRVGQSDRRRSETRVLLAIVFNILPAAGVANLAAARLRCGHDAVTGHRRQVSCTSTTLPAYGS